MIQILKVLVRSLVILIIFANTNYTFVIYISCVMGIQCLQTNYGTKDDILNVQVVSEQSLICFYVWNFFFYLFI